VIEPVLAGLNLVHPIDFEFGPDGSMYLLEYGSGYFSGAADAGLYKINYVQGGRSPIARATASVDNGLAPLTVAFSSAGSSDPDGNPLSYAWDFDNNGSTDSTAANPSYTYTSNGDKRARLTVNDGTGRSATILVPIVVGNNRPVVALNGLPAGGLFSWQDNLTATASASDPQDGAVPCASVVVRAALGHQEHAHEEGEGTGCGATFNTGPVHAGADAVLFFVIRGGYTDRGASGSVPLTGEKEITLWPKQWQAEHYAQLNGPAVIEAGGAEGGKRLGDIQNGEWVKHHAVSLKGITGVRARVSSDKAGNVVSLRYDSPTGPEVARATVPNTGGWDTYTEVTAPVSKPDDGTHDLYVVFTGGSGALLDLDSYTFTGAGVGTPAGPGGPRVGALKALGKCADINGAATADGTRVQIWDCGGSPQQTWTIGTDGTVRGLGKCLDVTSSGLVNGTKVQLYTCNATGAQQWVTAANGGLRNPQSGRCLDIPSSNTTNGNQLQIYDCNGTAAQNWTLA
jgi:PKD repeat protein